MAIDQTDKAQNMATETVNAVQQFMEALETLRGLEDGRAAAGHLQIMMKQTHYYQL